MVLLDISKKGYIEKKERCNFMSGQIEIETIGLTKKFGGLTAVDNVDFVLHKGKLESIIGPNGAGKTTFFNMICGNLSPTKGKIILDGEEITGLSPNQIARKGIARTFQQTSIFLGMDVFENVRISVQLGYNNKIPIFSSAEGFTDVTEKVKELLSLVGLYNKRNDIAENLSHGTQRLLQLAIVLGINGKVLLLDEPTAGLSPKETIEFTDTIMKVRETLVSTILFISHDIDTVMNISDSITVFHEGRVLATNSPKKIGENKKVQEVYLRQR